MKLSKTLLALGLGLVVAFGLSVNAVADNHGGEADLSGAVATGDAGGAEENGTDPRDMTAKFMPYYRFNKIDNGLESHETTLFGLLPIPFGDLIGQPEYKWALTYEFPALKYVDASAPINAAMSSIPPAQSIDLEQGVDSPIPAGGIDDKVWGVGDLNARLIIPIYPGEFMSLLTGAEFWFPTASDDLLGTGKYQVAPHITAVFDLAKDKGIFLASMNFWRTSVGGDGDRADIELYVGRHFLNIPFGQTGFYTLTELQTICDFEDDEDWEIWFGPEFGKVLAPGRILYAKPGFGIDPDADEREWSFEVGYRHFF